MPTPGTPLRGSSGARKHEPAEICCEAADLHEVLGVRGRRDSEQSLEALRCVVYARQRLQGRGVVEPDHGVEITARGGQRDVVAGPGEPIPDGATERDLVRSGLRIDDAPLLGRLGCAARREERGRPVGEGKGVPGEIVRGCPAAGLLTGLTAVPLPVVGDAVLAVFDRDRPVARRIDRAGQGVRREALVEGTPSVFDPYEAALDLGADG